MKAILHVLSVGTTEQSARICDTLLMRQKCHLLAVREAQELSSPPSGEWIDVAILHASLGRNALRQSARAIRRQWPWARILLLGMNSEILDASLYEERLSPAASAEALLASIELLAAASRRLRPEAGAWSSTHLPPLPFHTICADIKEVRTQP